MSVRQGFTLGIGAFLGIAFLLVGIPILFCGGLFLLGTFAGSVASLIHPPNQPSATITSVRVIDDGGKHLVKIRWTNTGNTPIRKLRCEVAYLDATGATIKQSDYTAYEGAGIAPGETYESVTGEGFEIADWSGDIASVRQPWPKLAHRPHLNAERLILGV